MDRHEPLDWNYVTYFVTIHLLGIAGIGYAATHASWAVIIFAVFYFFAAHLSITCGAHRFYAHESYQASQELQYIWVTLFAATGQGPIIWWAGKHRLHHNQEDKAGDPHSPLHGFFHSHMGWLLYKSGWKNSTEHTASFYRRRDKYAAALWQSDWWMLLFVVMGFGVPFLVGAALGDSVGGILVAGFTRVMFQYHLTWIVNSVGHTFGEHRGRSKTATNNWWLAIPTVGESFHANHHDEANNYRLGRRWYDIDLGWYAIKACIWLGLAGEPVRT